MNKCDMVDDEELLDLGSRWEIRELPSEYDFPGDDTPSFVVPPEGSESDSGILMLPSMLASRS